MTAASATACRTPAAFIGHGGGPLPVITPNSGYKDLWSGYARQLFPTPSTRPSAIIVVSAHYEARGKAVLVGGAAKPTMVYDYGGFPPESYKLRYEAPGEPALAARVADLLKRAGISAEVEKSKGFDHGVFVPLMLMFPAADIPVVPLSVMASQNPAEHVAIGRALASLRDEGVFILGSGYSNHNFAYFFGSKKPADKVRGVGAAFHDRLNSTLTDATTSGKQKLDDLLNFLNWPGAEESQAWGGADHFMPFFTCLGSSLYFAENDRDAVDSAHPELLWTGDFPPEQRPPVFAFAVPWTDVLFPS